MMHDGICGGPATMVFISRDGIGCCADRASTEWFPDREQTQERMLGCSARKPELIEEVQACIAGETCSDIREALARKAALMLDEMLENALYAAPRDEQGQPIFPKGTSRSLLPTEQIRVRYCFDGSRLTLEVTDSWGTLTAAQLFSCLAMNLAETEPDADRAGRGLFFMWRLMDQLYVRIDPGKSTIVGGCLSMSGCSSAESSEEEV